VAVDGPGTWAERSLEQPDYRKDVEGISIFRPWYPIPSPSYVQEAMAYALLAKNNPKYDVASELPRSQNGRVKAHIRAIYVEDHPASSVPKGDIKVKEGFVFCQA